MEIDIKNIIKELKRISDNIHNDQNIVLCWLDTKESLDITIRILRTITNLESILNNIELSKEEIVHFVWKRPHHCLSSSYFCLSPSIVNKICKTIHENFLEVKI